MTSEQIQQVQERFSKSLFENEEAGSGVSSQHVGQLYVALLEIAYQLAINNERQRQSKGRLFEVPNIPGAD